MREIKFRGKCMCSNEWVYGDLIHKRHDWGALMIQDDNGLGSDVIPESVGQFTGLHDKDGKEIYEGDIIDFYSAFWRDIEYPEKIDPNHFYQLVVAWNPRDCGFGLVSLKEALLLPQEQQPCGITQVSDSYLIGNIYDNPNLLAKPK